MIRVDPASKLGELVRVIRDSQAHGITPTEIRVATGHSPNSTAPLLWWLEAAGVICRHGTRGAHTIPEPKQAPPASPWPQPVYVTARARRLATPSTERHRP